MLDQLVLQVKRLFSSKTNSGKLVYKLTDRLHFYKQVLLAISIILLIGYSQFRSHFECQSHGNINKETMTNWCWNNGTTTVVLKNQAGDQMLNPVQQQQYIQKQITPHVGMGFKPAEDVEYELIKHDYMRNLWALLFLLVACSYVAQRQWSSIFQNDILKALLHLPGADELNLVKKAQKAEVCKTLSRLPASPNLHELTQQPKKAASESMAHNNTSPGNVIINVLDSHHKHQSTQATNRNSNSNRNKKLAPDLGVLFQTIDAIETIDVVAGEENEHNHTLDYYTNQLIYLLLARRTAAYKLSGLSLKRKLLIHSLSSFSLTSLQYLLPWLLIGPQYTLYGWQFAKAWSKYALYQLYIFASSRRSQIRAVNPPAYELSARIWPISTQCLYTNFDYQQLASFTVQCTVSINEICSKIFAIIWWFVAINIIIEFYSLCMTLLCCLNFNTLKWIMGRRVWPKCKREAEVIATFRYKHALLLMNQTMDKQSSENHHDDDTGHSDTDDGSADPSSGTDRPIKKPSKSLDRKRELSERERKHLEAQEGNKRRSSDTLSEISLRSKKWYLWCSRDVCRFLAVKGKELGEKKGKLMVKPSKTPQDEDGYKEICEDCEIYYLLHLLYLRLNCSRKKIAQIIRITSFALDNYLSSLNYAMKLKNDTMTTTTTAEGTADDDYSSVRSSQTRVDIGPPQPMTQELLLQDTTTTNSDDMIPLSTTTNFNHQTLTMTTTTPSHHQLSDVTTTRN